MTPKTVTERNRDKEARKKAAGLREYRIWAPASPEGEVRDELKRCAAKLVRKHMGKKEEVE